VHKRRSLALEALSLGPGVVLLEGVHEGDQGVDSLDRHGVVEGGAAATD